MGCDYVDVPEKCVRVPRLRASPRHGGADEMKSRKADIKTLSLNFKEIAEKIGVRYDIVEKKNKN